MDGASIVTSPTPVVVTLAGKRRTLSAITIADHGEIERRIVSMKPHPLDAIKGHLHGLTESEARYILDLAYTDTLRMRRASPEQIAEYLRTSAGFSLLVWLSARKSDRDLSEDEIAADVATLTRDGISELQDQIDAASGYQKNCDGRPRV